MTTPQTVLDPTPRAMPFVPDARFDLSDILLEHLQALAHRVLDGHEITEAEGTLILCAFAPALDELVQRRAAMAAIETLVQPGTVVAFNRGQA